jgi:Ran GTPase-activating protein (RanGAP) involved in mRNA processing and transport
MTKLLWFILYSSYLFTQTVAVLALNQNQIEDIGVQHLADALRSNEVPTKYYSSLSNRSVLFPQTLISLDLSGNRISDDGAQHLADALRQNKVIDDALLSVVSRTCSSFADTCRT